MRPAQGFPGFLKRLVGARIARTRLAALVGALVALGSATACFAQATGSDRCAPETAFGPTAAVPPGRQAFPIPHADRFYKTSDGRLFRTPENGSTCDVTDMAVAVGAGGRFRKIDGSEPRPIAPSKAVGPVIKRLVEQAKASGPGPIRILIYAHGGLVSHEQAVADARSLAPFMLHDGYAPIFLIWNSDFVTTYGERLCCVSDGQATSYGRLYFWPSRLGGDVVGSAARAPETLGKQWIRFRDSDLRRKTPYRLTYGDQTDFCAPAARVSKTRPPADEPCPDLVFPKFASDDDAKHLNGRGANLDVVPYALLTPVRWGATMLAPEVGAQAWDNMVRRTRLALAYAQHDGPPPGGGCETWLEMADGATGAGVGDAWTADDASHRSPYGDGGFGIFFEQLQCEIEYGALKPFKDRIEIDFYGHSMGALVGDEILSRYPDLPWGRVVYMAAASSMRDVRLAVIPALRSHSLRAGDAKPMQFYSLMLHPLAESDESEGFNIPPKGSLLEWVDEMFAGPQSVEDRTFGKWLNIRQTVRLFPPDVRRQMHFRVFASQAAIHDATELAALGCRPVFEKADRSAAERKWGELCNPVKHGDFTRFAFWRTTYVTGCALTPSPGAVRPGPEESTACPDDGRP